MERGRLIIRQNQPPRLGSSPRLLGPINTDVVAWTVADVLFYSSASSSPKRLFLDEDHVSGRAVLLQGLQGGCTGLNGVSLPPQDAHLLGISESDLCLEIGSLQM